ERLYALRAAAQAQRQAAELPAGGAEATVSSTPAVPWETAGAGSLAQAAQKVAALPEHLGWGSATLTAVLRRRRAKPTQRLLDAGWLAERDAPKTPAGEPAASSDDLV